MVVAQLFVSMLTALRGFSPAYASAKPGRYDYGELK
jgi:hypothetical protein